MLLPAPAGPGEEAEALLLGDAALQATLRGGVLGAREVHGELRIVGERIARQSEMFEVFQRSFS